MRPVEPLFLQGFKGLDLRLTAEASDPLSMRVANNVDLTIGGGLKSRDQLVKIADLDSTSLGLYVGRGTLRSAVPLPAGTIPDPPPGIKYDYFANNATAQTGGALALDGVQMWDGIAYLSIKRYVDASTPEYGFMWEHHYAPEKLKSELPGTVTLVNLPFAPGPNLWMQASKIWGHDANTNLVWYSSSINGPTDWTNSGDAGYLNVTQHAVNDQTVRGFGRYEDKLMVVFKDSIQFWSVFADPADNSLAQALNGVGTENNRTVVDMGGIATYFARGSFRTIQAVAVTGEKNDTDIGAKIYAVTKDIDLSAVTPVSIWSPGRSQLMCAFGDIMYVYTNNPGVGVTGWTKYTLPSGFNVTAMVELDGVTYLRTGTSVYKFDSAYTAESGFSWTARFPFNHATSWGRQKAWTTFESASSGRMGIAFYVDPRNETYKYIAPTLSGSRFGTGRVPLAIVANCISPEFTGTVPWTLDSFNLMHRKGNQ